MPDDQNLVSGQCDGAANVSRNERMTARFDPGRALSGRTTTFCVYRNLGSDQSAERRVAVAQRL
jgi:hypothetical protein